jgi:hypothetical protein
MSGCPAKYAAKAVVPHFGAPTIRKSGRFSEDGVFGSAARSEKLSDDIGTIMPQVSGNPRNKRATLQFQEKPVKQKMNKSK